MSTPTTARLAALVREVSSAPAGMQRVRLYRVAAHAAALCSTAADAPDEGAARDVLVAAYVGRNNVAPEGRAEVLHEGTALVAAGWRWGAEVGADLLADLPYSPEFYAGLMRGRDAAERWEAGEW